MMVKVGRRCTFDAAHFLEGYQGPCANMHGHTYTVEVMLLCPVNQVTGIGIDLGDLKEFLYREVVARFDHRCLNDLMDVPTTAEMIAATVMDAVKREYPKHPALVKVYESPDSWVELER